MHDVSSVGFPSGSSRQADGIFCPLACAICTLPYAVALVAMSSRNIFVLSV
eukprot:CAMPEP_0175987050 /NCGR_PEP_ID=MMETSP0108-20121206/50487_1 /TAXON_ID=195067 ORGANISM="Goniomonas pacifica, Strain CCMP1869" /NCGR_SAMPLE_ID=MMETSP0108 /ASSEMBLY_ACC=CAM_ASM_000204 /LENGTH=50 /DNA_ID=CAMNT_0017318271 /DNA_START=74 /DNA_END=223 /DNA_ORIENTATION=-